MQSPSEHKNPGRPRNESLVTFDTNEFLGISFQVKLALWKFWTIFWLSEVAGHRQQLLSGENLLGETADSRCT